MISIFFGFIIRVVILEPMSLLGAIIGVCGWYFYGLEIMFLYAKTPITYGVLYGIALFYTLAFKHVYRINSKKIDWWSTFTGSFAQFFTLVFATVCTTAIIYAITYNSGEKLDNYLRHK